MHTALQSWFGDATSVPLLQLVPRDIVARGLMFLLVAARLAGFFCVGPMLGRPLVSWPVRFGLTGLLTLIVAPGLPIAGRDATPVMLVNHETPAATLSADPSTVTLGSDEMSPINIVLPVFREASIGAAMAMAVAAFLGGLRLGGEWLDRHSGLGIGGVLNPEYSSGGSAPAELTFLFGVVALLVTQPVNGHLLVVRFVLDSFHAIPVGPTAISGTVFSLMKAILQQSLILGLRIAMPFVVMMTMLDMTLGWIRRSSRWELAPTAYVLRVGASLLILAATLPGIQEAVSVSLRETLSLTNDSLIVGESSP
jgi:flagellar biosynthetic protein FliR